MFWKFIGKNNISTNLHIILKGSQIFIKIETLSNISRMHNTSIRKSCFSVSNSITMNWSHHSVGDWAGLTVIALFSKVYIDIFHILDTVRKNKLDFAPWQFHFIVILCAFASHSVIASFIWNCPDSLAIFLQFLSKPIF